MIAILRTSIKNTFYDLGSVYNYGIDSSTRILKNLLLFKISTL